MKSLAILIVCVASVARADEASTLVQQALDAAHAQQWDVALDKLDRAYRIDPQPSTLGALAVVQEKTDHLIAARKSFIGYIAATQAAKDKDARAKSDSARKKLEQLESVIPTLAVRLVNLDGTTISLDGRELTPNELSLPIFVDPGSHQVAALRAGSTIVERSVTVSRGDHDTVELSPPVLVPPPVDQVPDHPKLPPPPPITPPIRPNPPPSGPSILASPWFWGIAGGVALAAAGAGFYHYVYDASKDPTHGSLGSLSVP
jgi:hypothetical protein